MDKKKNKFAYIYVCTRHKKQKHIEDEGRNTYNKKEKKGLDMGTLSLANSETRNFIFFKEYLVCFVVSKLPISPRMDMDALCIFTLTTYVQ